MSDEDEGPIARAGAVATIYADVALVIDRGETVHCLLCTDRPLGGDGPSRVAETWVVFPRSGFMAFLFEASETFLPGLNRTSPDGRTVN